MGNGGQAGADFHLAAKCGAGLFKRGAEGVEEGGLGNAKLLDGAYIGGDDLVHGALIGAEETFAGEARGAQAFFQGFGFRRLLGMDGGGVRRLIGVHGRDGIIGGGGIGVVV